LNILNLTQLQKNRNAYFPFVNFFTLISRTRQNDERVKTSDFVLIVAELRKVYY
jgi:hypothetical protein